MASTQAQTFQQRIQQLQQTATQYITNEQTNITNTVSSVKAILSGRTGGQGVQASSQAAVSIVAFNDLSTFLNG